MKKTCPECSATSDVENSSSITCPNCQLTSNGNRWIPVRPNPTAKRPSKVQPKKQPVRPDWIDGICARLVGLILFWSGVTAAFGSIIRAIYKIIRYFGDQVPEAELWLHELEIQVILGSITISLMLAGFGIVVESLRRIAKNKLSRS